MAQKKTTIPPMKAFLTALGRGVQVTLRRFINHSAFNRASGLAFSTLTALVPLSAMVFALMEAFGALDAAKDQLQVFLLDQLIPAQSEELFAIIEGFIANSTALGVIGFIGFLFSSMGLLNGVYASVNYIWGIRGSRAGFPVNGFISTLVLVSLAVSATAAVGQMLGQATGTLEVAWLAEFLLPNGLLFLVFFAMVRFVPNTSVRWQTALFAGIFGTFVYQIGNIIFVATVNSLISISVIYGSFTTVFIFLLWLYILWLLVLLVLEASYTIEYGLHHHGERNDLDMLLGLYGALVRSFVLADGKSSPRDLSIASGMGRQVVLRLLETLKEQELASKTEDRWLPSHDPSSITLGKLCSALALASTENLDPGSVFLRYQKGGEESLNHSVRSWALENLSQSI